MSNITWTGLTPEQQSNIIKRHTNSRESIRDLSNEFNLNPESLARKIRDLTAKNTLNYYLNYMPQNGTLSYTQQEAFDIKITNIESINPSDKIAFIKPKRDTMRLLVVSDIHFGQEDQDAVKTFLYAQKHIPVDLIILLGDIFEFYGLSTFAKNPQLMAKSLQSEIDAYTEFMDELDNIETPKISAIGNHELRYLRHLEANPYLYAVSDYTLDKIMKVDKYKLLPMVDQIIFSEDSDMITPNPTLVLMHGTKAQKHGGTSARLQSENYGYINYGQGHSHKLSVVQRRTLRGIISVFETGCLATLNPEWVNFPDYNQGFMYVQIVGDYVAATPIPIHEGKAYFGAEIL